MNFTFENQGTNTYMVYRVGTTEEIDTMSLGMITNNKILGLAPTVFYQQDTTKYFKYNVSSKISADQFLMGTVNKKRIIGVFSGIVNAMISAEEYMIDANSLCLDLQYIYTDVSTCETVMICLPIANPIQQNQDIKAFFKNIVFSTQFDQTENCDYIAKLINYLNSASVFSLYDFKDLLDTIANGATPAAQPAPQAVTQPASQPIQQVQTQSVVTSQPVQQVQPQSVPQPAPVQPVVKPQAVVTPAPMSVPQGNVPVQSSVPAGNAGFAIPGQQGNSVPGQAKSAENVATQPSDEKEISWLYLMQHYNKENAALYKAQQEAKKAAKAAGTPAKPDKKKDKKDKKEKNKKDATPTSVANPGFAIPGQAPQSVSAPTSSPVVPPQPVSIPQQTPVPQATSVIPQAVPVQPTPVIPQSAPTPVVSQSPVNFGETTVLSNVAIGETTVLGASSMQIEINPYLVREKNNEKILLDKPVFRIGKERSFVDYFIGDNTAISRSHANIITREGEYFVQDTNSTNHTYVNGQMIQSNVEVKISHGTKIRLANEEFEFKIY